MVREHWHDRRQEHSCGNRSSNTDPACDSCSPSPEMPVAAMWGSKWWCDRGEPELGGARACRFGSGQARRARGPGRAGAYEVPCGRECRRPPRWFVRTGAIAGRSTAAGIAAQNTDPACDSCSLATRSAGCTDVGLKVAVRLGNQSSEVRRTAAEALGKLGEHAASAAPALTKCLADEDLHVRRGGW